MTRTLPTLPICCGALLLLVTAARGQDWDLGEYPELQADPAQAQQAQAAVADKEPALQPPDAPAAQPRPSRSVTDQAGTVPPEQASQRVDAEAPAAKTRQVSASVEPADRGEHPRHVIRFGAGASWMHALNLTAAGSDDRLLSDFSVSWAPFGLPGEIGVDLLIARDQKFFVRPNLKFYFFKHYWFSIFLEGTCELMFLSGSTEVGGGGGLGLVIGLTDALAIEVKATATVVKLSQTSGTELFGRSAATEQDLTQAGMAGDDLVVLPSATINLMARF